MKEDEIGSKFTREAHDTFWDCFDEVAKDNNSDCRDKENPIQRLTKILKTSRIDRNHDSNNWRPVISNQYPQLSRFAQIYLSVGSSVYRERLFSVTGLVYEVKRSHPAPTNTKNLVFIHHDLSLLYFQ